MEKEDETVLVAEKQYNSESLPEPCTACVPYEASGVSVHRREKLVLDQLQRKLQLPCCNDLVGCASLCSKPWLTQSQSRPMCSVLHQPADSSQIFRKTTQVIGWSCQFALPEKLSSTHNNQCQMQKSAAQLLLPHPRRLLLCNREPRPVCY